jgi:chemotaxis protein histidine kinase CheA
MDVNTKVKELEDELRVLKTEIRNVLLDVREVILERSNPLSEQEPSYLRLDLNTTAQTIATEEATRSAAEANAAARAAAKAEQAKAEQQAEPEPEPELELRLQEPEEPEPEPEPEDSGGDSPLSEAEAVEQGAGEEPAEAELEQPEEPEDGGLAEPPPEDEPPMDRRPRIAAHEPAEVPPAYFAYPPLTIGMGSLAAWVAEAMAAIGPQQLDRVITIHRLWGCLPPNISQALAHLQELIRCSQEAEPPWLKIMQDMERLSSS